MSIVTLNGNDLMRLKLRLPLYGAWVADVLHADPTLVPSVGASATIALESQTFVGTIVRTSYLQDLGWDSLVVGGRGGLSTQLPPDQFFQPVAQDILNAALTLSGEVASSTIASSLLAPQWPSWRRTARTFGQELDEICSALSRDTGESISWRILSDGSVWIGAETWTSAFVPDFDTMSGNAAAGRHTIAAEDPTVLPGQTWYTGERIGEVVHRVEPEETRTEIWTVGVGDREVGALDALLPPLDLYAVYPYRVVTQNADKTLELKSTDLRLSDLSRVPMRFGIPGTSADIPSGAVVLVAFTRGDERDPYAVSWQSGTATNMAIQVQTLLELGSSPAASMVALATLTDARITALQAKLDSLIAKYDIHVHPGVTAGVASTLVTLSTETTLGPLASVAATKVKAT